MHRPQDWGLPLLQEVFPGCAPIWAAPSRAPAQHPPPHPGDAGGDSWPRLEHGSREAAANAAPYHRQYPQCARGWGVQVCPRGLDTPDWSHWQWGCEVRFLHKQGLPRFSEMPLAGVREGKAGKPRGVSWAACARGSQQL